MAAAPMPKPGDERWYYALSSYPAAVRKSYEEAQTERYKAEFKRCQQTAFRVIKKLKAMSSKKPKGEKAEMAFILSYRTDRDGNFYMNIKARDRFEYSFVYHLISVLQEKRFSDVVQTCAHCNRYFLKLSDHRKECCSHRCSQIVARKKKLRKDKHGENKKNALYQLYHRAKAAGYAEEERARLLTRHVRKNGYDPGVIPKSYRDLMQKYAGR